MSVQIVFKQSKQDGWSDEMSYSPDGIYGMDENLWRKICLSVSTWSEWYQSKSNDERRKLLRKAFEMEIEAERERFEFDLKNSVRLYPLPGVRR